MHKIFKDQTICRLRLFLVARLKLVERRRPIIKPNWLELPADITAKILHKLGAFEILDSAQKVCTTWHKICKDPAMWRVVDMSINDLDDIEDLDDMPYDYEKLLKTAIDRSQGQLVDINIQYLANVESMAYMADRSPQLRCLQIAYCDCLAHSWTNIFIKVPLLEELTLISTRISAEAIADAHQYCPKLRSITYISECAEPNSIEDYANLVLNYAEVLALAINMSQLRHLTLVGYAITRGCLKAILDGCPQLELLDMQCCFSIKLDENIEERCMKQIKDLKLPEDDANFSEEVEDPEDDSNFSKKIGDCLARLDDKFFEGIDASRLFSSPQLRSKMRKRLCSFMVSDMM